MSGWRDYYGRFYRSAWSEFSLFGQEQVFVGLIVGVIQAFREGQNGAIEPQGNSAFN